MEGSLSTERRLTEGDLNRLMKTLELAIKRDCCAMVYPVECHHLLTLVMAAQIRQEEKMEPTAPNVREILEKWATK